MNAVKHCILNNKIDGRAFATGYFRRLFSKTSAAPSANSEEEIEIPNRIERGPTDILKALASTVNTDFTAPHYRYHDDPWLIPYTNMEKRDLWLARESGRDTAKFIAAKYPHLFEKNRIHADPPIAGFQPKSKLNRDNVTKELLENYIEGFQVEDAITVYELLQEKKVKISKETEQQLLELLAYYAETEELRRDNQTSRELWYKSPAWATGGLAEKLYSKLQTPSARLAMLLGLTKYRQTPRAVQIWKEMEANNDPRPIEAYNAIISTLSCDDVNDLKAKLVHYLKMIRTAGLQPDEVTLISCLNAVLKALPNATVNTNGCLELSMSLLSEFKQFGVEPCLGVYFQLLQIFYSRENKVKSMIIRDILEQIKDKDMWPAKTMDDFKFFRRAMHVAFNLNQVNLAYSIHEILHTGNNVNLLTSMYECHQYYTNFAMLVLRNESLDVSWKLYSKLTPHIWSPDSDFYENLLMQISMNGAVQYLGKLYDDMELGSHGNSKKDFVYQLNTMVLKIIDANPSSQSEFTNLSESYADIAYRIFTYLNNNRASKGLYLKFNTQASEICSLAIQILVLEGQYKKACEVFEFCMEEREKMPGQLTEVTLQKFMEAVVEAEDIELGIQVIDYLLSINSPEALQQGTNLAKLNLTNSQRKILNKFFANHQKWINLS